MYSKVILLYLHDTLVWSMRLKKIDVNGFKSFGRHAAIIFDTAITGVVGPNGSGKSNVVESIRFALGEQSMKSMRGGQSTDFLFKSGTTGRGVSRASVSLVFDNSDRVFRLGSVGDGGIVLDTDEVVVSRDVYSDGSQKYAINGASARMRDVVELIASVNIGSSGHHIISQGESDRFLFSSPKDRRILLEEALGLKIYHYRIHETERKLEKSRNALREARILHKELEPHVKFLRKQIEKINQAQELRDNIRDAYNSVLSPLQSVIGAWGAAISSSLQQTEQSETVLRDQEKKLFADLEALRASVKVGLDTELQSNLQLLRDQERVLVRDISKQEISIEHIQRDIKKLQIQLQKTLEVKQVQHVSLQDVQVLLQDLRAAFSKDADLIEIIAEARRLVHGFESTLTTVPDTALSDQIRQDIDALGQELSSLESAARQNESRMRELVASISTVESSIRSVHQSEIESRSAEFDVERQLSGARQEIQTLVSNKLLLQRESEELSLLESQYESDLLECRAFFGVDWAPDSHAVSLTSRAEISATLQVVQSHRRQLDRLRIKLEDAGVTSADDIIREHNETEQRYTALGAQIDDIESTISELEPLLARLQQEIRSNFIAGIERINQQFGEFFVTMFGGGFAEIVVIDAPRRNKKKDIDGVTEDGVDAEQGVDIRVKIPNKKQGDLSILSGGERSLTSIALLFSLSQVNPPPFIVLDETDAALDEANSRRYGQLMKKLSEISQIIVVTHNRETMSHCQRLYGVTLGGDSASQLFSVKFEEALQYAK